MMATLAASLGLIVLFCAVVIVQVGFVVTLIVTATVLSFVIGGVVALCTWATGRRAA